MNDSPATFPEAEDPYAVIRHGRRIPLAAMGRRDERRVKSPPKIALVIGTFAAVPYVHLHLEARRRLYPEIPVLVHDDHSPKGGELAGLCERYGAGFAATATRFPPCKGDLSAFICGLVWARECGADVLVKMSRRFIPKIRWVDGLESLVREADYATYSSWTTSFDFGFRTECLALAVEEWFALGLVDQMIAAVHAPGSPFVEGFMHGLARQAAAANSPAARAHDARTGHRPKNRDGYAVWPFMGTDRRARSADHLWHDAAQAADYHALATNWGMRYDEADFADPNMGHGAKPEAGA